MFNIYRNPIYYLVIFWLLFITDRIAKYLAGLVGETANPVIDRYLIFGYYPNVGIGFGIRLPAWLIILFVSLIIVGLIVWLVRIFFRKDLAQLWGVSLIFSGAVNNFIDRIFFGQVIDYFKLFNWSIFNLSDVLIIAGVGLVLINWRRRSIRSGFTRHKP